MTKSDKKNVLFLICLIVTWVTGFVVVVISTSTPSSTVNYCKLGIALRGIPWGIEAENVDFLRFRMDMPTKDIEIYYWEPEGVYVFKDESKPQNSAYPKSIEFWFRNNKLCSVRAEFTKKEMEKMLPILNNRYEWRNTQLHEETNGIDFSRFVYTSHNIHVSALFFELDGVLKCMVTWYYGPLCGGLIGDSLWQE